MSDIREFISWYNNDFKTSILWDAMERTSENSPWHREISVAAHTDMVVMTLLGFQNRTLHDNKNALLALFAAAFHDVGKPSMRFEKHSEARGTYYSYAEHELRSARLWQDYFMTNRVDMMLRFGLSLQDFYTIAVMIEKHRPWGMKDKTKINGIFASIGESASIEYLNLLEADNTGRQTDDPGALKQSLDQIANFDDARTNVDVLRYQSLQKKMNLRKKLGLLERPVPQLIMPVAQAGSGKSSLFKDIMKNDPSLNPTGAEFYVHSMDVIRARLYGPDTEAAFLASLADSEFKKIVQHDFIAAAKEERSIYVDNTNLSAKRRRFYLAEASKRGYDTMAVLIPLSLRVAIDRNRNRTDKKLATKIVMQQYMALSMPLLEAEFDQIAFVS